MAASDHPDCDHKYKVYQQEQRQGGDCGNEIFVKKTLYRIQCGSPFTMSL